MNVRDALQKLEFGNPVAEYDKGLQNYFLITQSYLALINGEADLIAGDKGTGKTAIFQYIRRNFANEPSLAGIEIVTGFNPSGEPLFRKLGTEGSLPELQYVAIWKMYFLSLAGNWLLNSSKGKRLSSLQKLDALLNRLELRSEDNNASFIFTNVLGWVRRLRPKIEVSPDPTSPIGVATSIVFYQSQPTIETISPEEISYGQAFALLDSALSEQKKMVWVVIDRLDEAFVGLPDVEKPALRALLRTYLDLMDCEHLQMKLFLRKDLFRKLIEGGFVNLTHLNARKFEIIWDDEDLLALFAQRVHKSHEFMQMFGAVNATDQELFKLIFPEKMDAGKNRPYTWNWILTQIRDGNGVKSPRNLVDLTRIAQEEQLRREQRSPRKYSAATPIIEIESLKKALARLSQRRIEDTLLAEYGRDVQRAILAFKNGKSDHNESSLCRLFGFDASEARRTVEVLSEIGFLELDSNIYRVPDLYRAGLNIAHGKAF
jgi:hypothetical protein